MKFRRATVEDVKYIINIIAQAQKYFKERKIDQWQNGYPNEEVIARDIYNESSYVLTEDNKVVATAALYFDEEKNYKNIYEGNWKSNAPYSVIHRIAVSNQCKGRGVASIMLDEMSKLSKEKNVHNLRVDTHMENLSMQSLLKKNHFDYCGIIYIEDGGKRVAFEKNVK